MKLANGEIFMEDTVLVSRPAVSRHDLQARLYKQMESLNIEPLELLKDEHVAIPMVGMDPVVPQCILGYGDTASLVHPASGYMVAQAMELAPRVARSVTPALQKLRSRMDQNSDMVGSNRNEVNYQKEMDEISDMGWLPVWPTDEQ